MRSEYQLQRKEVHVRGFWSAIVAHNGTAIGNFAKINDADHSLVYMNAATNQASPLREIPEKGARQYGRFVVMIRESLKASKEKPKDKPKEKEIAGGVRITERPPSEEEVAGPRGAL